MNKLFGLVLAGALALGLAGCQAGQQEPEASSGIYSLYEGSVTVDGDKLLVNDFEFVDLADLYWIRTLDLTIEDMPNGYYIHDVSDELLTFTLDESTRYNFYDTGNLFVGIDDDKRYTTTDLAEFMENFDADGDGVLGNMPFEIQVLEDGRVLSISEIFVN